MEVDHMVAQATDEPFWGQWRGIDKFAYASHVLPAAFPPWLLLLTSGADGWIAALVGMIILRRHAEGPWVVVVYRTRSFRIPATSVIYRVGFDGLDAANDHAKHVDNELAAGRIPQVSA
jgi:hypothetical protein